MKKFFFYLLIAIVACTFTQCKEQPKQAKYIFYFIGDGMGPNEVLMTEMYKAELQGRIGTERLCMTQFPYSGQLSTFSDSNGITDSSAAGTCLATGHKTTNHMLGVTSDSTAVVSVAEILKANGWPVGVTTSVSIDHATPASFYAHSASRSDYYTIGTQLAATNYDFFGGATFYQPFDKNDSTAPNVYDLCEQNGYTFARGYQQFNELKDSAEKIIFIQDFEGLEKTYKGNGLIPYALGREKADALKLQDIVKGAVDFLSKKDDHFFLMCEGGAIDWSCHSNDAAAVIGEVMELDSAVQVAYNFYLAHPDETLIVVTADHETGGLALGNSNYTLNLQLLQNQKHPIGTLHQKLRDLHEEFGKTLTFDQVKALLTEELGFYEAVEITEEDNAKLLADYKNMMSNNGEVVKTLYQDIDGLINDAVLMLNTKAKLGWTTTGHSAAAVPVFAIGVGAEKFAGWHDNSEIAPMMLSIAGITEE